MENIKILLQKNAIINFNQVRIIVNAIIEHFDIEIHIEKDMNNREYAVIMQKGKIIIKKEI